MNCPFTELPFRAYDACESGCPQFDAEQEVCRWYHPPRPIVEILDTAERLQRLEKITYSLRQQLRDLIEQMEDLKTQPRKAAPRVARESPPKLTGGVKL
jgi:hypothetical protein